jgi:hypothetical protein
MRVVDIAGIEVGDVTDVARDRFLVRLLSGEHMWLSDLAFLGLADDDDVRLVCGWERIDRYRTEPPLLPSVNW